MGKVLLAIVGLLPPSLLRWVGRVQFRVPLLRRLLGGVAGRFVDAEATIQNGFAKGLKICATGAHPGYVLGTSEPVLQETLARHLRQGDVFYDLGANIGFFTLLASRLVGSGGAVVAFEPDPANRRVLEANVARNGIANVEVVEKAVAGRSGALRFAAVESTRSRFARNDEPGIEVPVTTLDDFVAEGWPVPTLVKLDIEGAEVEALDGARALLTQHRPTIVCEVHDTEAEVRARLEAAGYAVYELEVIDAESWNPHLLALPELAEARPRRFPASTPAGARPRPR